MADDFCWLCLLPESMCGHRRNGLGAPSRGLAQNYPAEPSRIGLPADLTYDWAELWRIAHPDDGLGEWIEARYYGSCRGCGERWVPGDLIGRSADEDGWLCASCGG